MAIFRINKTKDYTTMSNFHLKNKEMSLKAKGLLSLMLSLPDNWDFSIEGLEQITSDGKTSISGGLKELETFGYLKRNVIREKGKYIDLEYQVYEQALISPPQAGFPPTVKPISVNQPQLNTNIYNTKELIEKKEIVKEKREYFTKPKIEDIKEYCLERKNGIDATKFFNYYESVGWFVGSKRMKDWKACVRYWETNALSKKPNYQTQQNVELKKSEEGSFKLT